MGKPVGISAKLKKKEKKGLIELGLRELKIGVRFCSCINLWSVLFEIY